MPSHALSNLPVGSLMGLEVRLSYLARTQRCMLSAVLTKLLSELFVRAEVEFVALVVVYFLIIFDAISY
jgi:hypothetical protein